MPVTLVILVACLVALLPVQAALGSPLDTPPPPPPTGPGLDLNYVPGSDPFSFHFVRGLGGYNFKPGEQVTITAAPPLISPTTVAVGQYGVFNLQVSYRWVYCGPRATTQSPPLFTATGNEGDTARTGESPEPCPQLSSRPVNGSEVPVGAGPVAFAVQAFGFAPGEQAAVREEQAGPYGAGQTVRTVADAVGRIRTQVQAYVPPPCAPWDPYPVVSAGGDQGTSIASPLGWYDSRVATCPNRNPSLPPPPPPAGQTVTQAVTAPPPPPGPRGVSISLHLAPASVHPGRLERAVLQVGGASTKATLTVADPGHRRVSMSAQATNQGRYVFRWRIPRHVRTGIAHVAVVLEPWKTAVHGTFHVR